MLAARFGQAPRSALVRVSKDGCKCSVWFETMCSVQAHTAAERNIFGDPEGPGASF
jgi:hypothetical protein